MSVHAPEVPTLSVTQRRSHLLLMLFAPLPSLSLTALSDYGGGDPVAIKDDLAQIEQDIHRIYRLRLLAQPDDCYAIEGNVLNKRLCLIESLRRALRLCPDAVKHYYLPLHEQQCLLAPPTCQASEQQLEEISQGYCALLNRPIADYDRWLIELYVRYVLTQFPLGQHPEFNQHQLQWLRQKAEYGPMAHLFRHWPLPEAELIGFTLLARLLKTPQQTIEHTGNDRRLLGQVQGLIERFEQVSQMTFIQPELLTERLFTHLSAALERCHFHLGINYSLQGEVEEMYPRLLRTTRTALMPLEAEYRIRFSSEEVALIAVLLGAWLIQDSELQEKQVVILTQSQGAQEKKLELQIRELTLLPLQIKFQSLEEFAQQGAPKNTLLVVTPFALPLPLFSPPLLLVRQPLPYSQQERIRKLLEA